MLDQHEMFLLRCANRSGVFGDTIMPNILKINEKELRNKIKDYQKNILNYSEDIEFISMVNSIKVQEQNG